MKEVVATLLISLFATVSVHAGTETTIEQEILQRQQANLAKGKAKEMELTYRHEYGRKINALLEKQVKEAYSSLVTNNIQFQDITSVIGDRNRRIGHNVGNYTLTGVVAGNHVARVKNSFGTEIGLVLAPVGGSYVVLDWNLANYDNFTLPDGRLSSTCRLHLSFKKEWSSDTAPIGNCIDYLAQTNKEQVIQAIKSAIASAVYR